MVNYISSDMVKSKITVKIADNLLKLDELCQEIIDSGEKTLGLDTETCTKKGTSFLSLIQVATTSCCYLFKMFKISESMGLVNYPDSFRKILGGDYVKVGFAINNDMCKINRYTGLKCINYVDVQSILRSKMYPFYSLDKTTKYFFPMENRMYSKNDHTIHRKWEDDIYTRDIILYAALDARYSLLCYWKSLYAPLYSEQINESVETSHKYEKRKNLYIKPIEGDINNNLSSRNL